MQLVAQINGGWSRCDVCGDGSAVVTIYREGPMESYRYTRESPCYGEITRSELTADELLDQMHADAPLIHTRRSRRSWKNLQRKIADGQVFWKKPAEPRRSASAAQSPYDYLVMAHTAPTVEALNQLAVSANAASTTINNFTVRLNGVVTDWNPLASYIQEGSFQIEDIF